MRLSSTPNGILTRSVRRARSWLSRPLRLGTHKLSQSAAPRGSAPQDVRFPWDEALHTVWGVLNRNIPADALQELYKALDQSERRPPVNDAEGIAFGFDTN